MDHCRIHAEFLVGHSNHFLHTNADRTGGLCAVFFIHNSRLCCFMEENCEGISNEADRLLLDCHGREVLFGNISGSGVLPHRSNQKASYCIRSYVLNLLFSDDYLRRNIFFPSREEESNKH